jgi:hypothetical protein
MVEFLPNSIIYSAKIALVRFHDVHHHLGILVLLILGDTTI